ncbi:nitroreductase family protein [Ruminococcaceae bacterium OttesenSCG-928-I18]|nr:nitroreductase family protein [Ruminococcaceae bacterium OttesenSCG-928-I18]
MTLQQAIEKRISRRRYEGPLKPDSASKLKKKMEALNAENDLSFSLVEDDPALFGGFSKSYGMFTGVCSFFMAAGQREDPLLHEKVGHAGQQLVLLATTLGQGTCWVGGSFDRAGVENLLPDWEQLVAVITVGPAAETPSAKERLLRRATHLRREEKNWQADGQAPAWFLEGCAAAARAPSALNARPVRFGYKDGRARAAIPAGAQAVQHVDLGIAKCHFELAAGGRFAPGSPALFEKG